MKRDCKTCEKNESQSYYACGFLPAEEREEAVHVPDIYPDFIYKVCPVHTFLKNQKIYEAFNLMRRSAIDRSKLSFYARQVLSVSEEYIALKMEREANKK